MTLIWCSSIRSFSPASVSEIACRRAERLADGRRATAILEAAYAAAVEVALVSDEIEVPAAAFALLDKARHQATALSDLHAAAEQAHQVALAGLKYARGLAEVEATVTKIGLRDAAAVALEQSITATPKPVGRSLMRTVLPSLRGLWFRPTAWFS
jgi:hypothetical protein